MTRIEILEALERDRSRLFNLLEGIPDDALVTQPVVDSWTVKDLVGHMALWHQVAIQFIADFVRDGVPKSLGLKDDAAINAYNAQGAAERRDWSLARAREELDASYRSLTSAIGQLRDDDLHAPLPDPWQGATLERLIAINSYDHNPEHIDQIAKWKQRKD